MTWLILVFAMEVGQVQDAYFLYNSQGVQTAGYTSELDSTYVKFEGEFQLLNNHIFAGGWIDNRQTMIQLDIWKPYRGIYGFNAGVRLWNFEIGYDHWCDHNVVITPGESREYMWAGSTKIYLRYEGRF